MMGWHDGGSFGWGGWVVMSLFMVALWALLIFGGIAIFRSVRHAGPPQAPLTPGSGDAQRLLDERFARGEIDEQEYTHRRDVLRSGG